MNIISVVTTDQMGAVAKITGLLSEHNIDIESINVQVIGADGVVHITTAQSQEALEVLIQGGYQAITADALLIRIEDVPGALAKVSQKLADQNINIRSMTMMQRNMGYNLVAISTDNNAKASELLEAIN
ncbi:ACT domain-containing protein [Porticoccaceae bacterium LTM1]|nr:ACT domain-containing protein [Porticoccaceae bacterium LTM1]